jgi:nitrite reductase (NADH) large subunit
MGVTCGALRRAQAEGCANVDALAEKTGASTVCGSCRPLLSNLTDEQPEVSPGPNSWMIGMSLISVVGALLFACVPAIPYAKSIQAGGLDVLWRTSAYKQLTGFLVAGLFATSVIFSMRKRLKILNWGDFETWRVVHAGIGLLCLGAGFLHTGFRLGQGLDFALISVVLGALLLGGVAGAWDVCARWLAPSSARALRAGLIRSHIYVLWPLPVLVTLHVVKVYFF